MGKLIIPIVIGLCAFAWRIYESMDMGRTIYNHRPGVCRQVHGPVKGSEDIEVIRSEGIAFVTSGLIYLQPTRAHVEGKMFLYDFNQKLGTGQLKAKELPIKGSNFDQNNFHPHGLSHWVVNGVIRLYVINHDDDFKHSIEVFDYDPSGPSLIHKKSLKHPSFIRPNNIVAVGADQLIITNDGVAQTEIGNFFEILSGYKGGTVYFWDGKESHQILSGMGAPNGIAYDIKTNKLFISEVNYRRIHAYDLAKDKKSVTLLSTVNLYSACDNLFLDSDGSVYSGCHSVLIETAKSIGDCDGEATSPSQVLRIKFDSEYKIASVSEPYSNDGKEVSGSSIAALYNNQMLIGTVCKGLLHCEVTHPSVL
ncbi:poml-3 [Pristionchus pacificus]|uniref:Paraoxonase n=1 Tax=Pristionchus pacificus TaxID=54126 RepID=A0A2A6CIE0_PRIPA|nr:poml-3 [Pristionchus pacificus]|eukprot:PDM77972.1 poml-3 [Pristionchus pacificus]